jgi:ferredoxin
MKKLPVIIMALILLILPLGLNASMGHGAHGAPADPVTEDVTDEHAELVEPETPDSGGHTSGHGTTTEEAAGHTETGGHGDSTGPRNWVVILATALLVILSLLFVAKRSPAKTSPFLRRILAHKLYPGIIQIPVAIVFAFIIYELLFGPAAAHDNFGTAMTWVLWWPLIPLFFILFGRLWCGICPFATLSDLIQKFFGRQKPVPKFLRKYGIWLIDLIFILITWSDHTVGIVENPRGSGVLLMLIVAAVIFCGIFFERRTWCRYLCFLGGVSGNYSRAGAMELRATPEICANCKTASCYKGNEKAPGCPMFEFPRTMDTNARCNLCGYCVKSCPNASVTIKTRIPTKELWLIRKPVFEESFLAVVIMGIVFVQNITMLSVWQPILTALESVTGTSNYYVNFTVTFLIAVGLPVLCLFAASFCSRLGSPESVTQNFARFGYALIPLDLAGHLAHNLFHLLAEGKAIGFTFLGLFGEQIEASAAVLNTPTIQVLQYFLILLGTLGSGFTAYKISRSSEGKGFLPHLILIILFCILNIYLFYLPMEMRM